MWSRFTGKSDSGSSASNRDKDDDARRRRTGDSTRSKRERDLDTRSVVSSTSTRKPSRRDTAPSSIASFVTAFDDVPRPRANDDLYEDPRDERYTRRREDRPTSYAGSSVTTTRRDRSRSRDRDEKDRKKSKDKDKDKKTEKRRSTRSEHSGSVSQAGGYRGDIVESPKPVQRSFSGQIASEGFSPFPGQAGAPMMSGALPAGSRPHTGGMSSHVQDQFPGQDPVQYATSALPGGNPFGAAADFYNDQGESVHQQPGVRPQPPSVIIGQDTPHLMSASVQANPVADTGSGAAADFYGTSTNIPPAKPPRPSSSTMPGSFIEEGPAPQKPPRPSSKSDKPAKPPKPSKFGPAALAGGAALGYAISQNSSNNQQHTTNYSSSNVQHSTSNYNSVAGSSASMYYQNGNPAASAPDGSNYPPPYSGASYGAEGAPPQKPPRPGKPEKQSSGSNAGLYAAGAAGLAAYGLHKHNSHSASQHSLHNYSSSTPGAFPGQGYNGVGPSPSPFMAGGMSQRHQHTGPVSKFVDWWKDYEDVQKMEEYTEYIGVCRGCFDPRSNVYDAPRKHHYNKRRSNEYMRPSGGIEKQSRYSLKEKKSHSSLSSGDEKRKRANNSAAGWVAAGLGGIGLAKAGQAVWNAGRNDFDDTYSIKSGRDPRSKTSHRSRSRSRDRKSYSYGSSEIRRRSRSRDRMSQMSVGVTKDKKDYKVIRRRSRSRSRSSSNSRDGKSGLIGTALGAGLAGAVLGAATKKKHRSRSRSRSPKKVYVQHNRRDSSDDERRRRRSQQLRRKSSRSSVSGASVVEIGQTHQSQGGFLGGFFAAPPPKVKQRRPSASSHKKKKKGFFNFGNASTSSSDSEMAFGTGYVRRRRRTSPKRRNSDERLKATLAGLGATAAAIAAAKAGKSASKRNSVVVAVKEHRHGRKSSDRPRPGSRYGDDEWEDLPDDGTSDSSSDAGLVYGDWRNGKSQESLVSNGSGTNKWGWRWGFGKKKARRSSDNLYDNIASTSLIGPTAAGAAGALTGVAIGTSLGRHDSESSSAQTLQSVYPVAPNDPTASFDARRTSSVPTPQPLITSGPGAISIQQPQPMHQVPGAIYSTQASSQPGYVAPAGPPVFSQASFQSPYPTQSQTQNVIVQTPQHSGYPPGPRRANSSPIQSSSWKRDAAIAGLAATAGAAALAAAKSGDRPPSEASNVRFNLTQEQAAKEERERRRQQDRRDEEESSRRDQQRREDQARREDEARREEEERFRREQLRRDEEARRLEEERRREQIRREDEARQEEEERRRRELQRQQEEARKYMEAERLAQIENERRLDERRRQQEDLRAREAREAEERDRQERDARAEAKRRVDLEAEAEQMRRERRETERRETERLEAARREAEIREDTERRRREREAQEYSSRYESDRERRKLEQQRTGSSVSSVATDVRRKEKELEERERDIVQPDAWKSTAAGAVAAGAAAAITSAAISSYKDKGKEKTKERDRDLKRTSSAVKTSEPSAVRQTPASSAKTSEPSIVRTYEPSNVKTYEPSNVKTYEPSKIEQDYFDDEIFDPNMFKKKESVKDVYRDWEDRYNQKPVSQADFFAPKELLENDNLPKVHPVDPNEGATDLHISQAHDDFAVHQPMVPPYPLSYSFTATKDGRSGVEAAWPVPSLNLIQPTPPGSRAPSVRSVSVPPSPNIEPIKEEPKEPKQERANRAGSRVSWGENQFHHFEVQTPDSYREQFVSDGDLKDLEKKYSQDEVTIEHESPKSGRKTSTYQPQQSEKTAKASEPKQIAPSTQYVRDENESTWDSIVSAPTKKSSKKDKKKAKAAAAATATAAAVTTAALLARDDDDDKIERDYRRDTSSVISNPFTDSHAAPSTVASAVAPSSVASSIPSTSSVYQSPHYTSVSDLDLRKPADQKSKVSGLVEGEVAVEPISMHIPGSFDEPPAPDELVEKDWEAPTKKGKKGKKNAETADNAIVAHDAPRRVEPPPVPVYVDEPIKEIVSEPEVKLSKKDKKKKAKAAKRASVDSWEESDVSPLGTPTIERDIRDIEPRRSEEPIRESTHAQDTKDNSRSGESSSSKVAAAAMAGGFAALMGSAMKQDQERLASDREHARHNLESADRYTNRGTPVSPPNGTRVLDDSVPFNTIPSAAFQDVEELADVKTPQRKKDKRHSSGKFSPTIGSPLRTEMKYEDYMGSQKRPVVSAEQPLVEAPHPPMGSAVTIAPEPVISRDVYDSGYYAPDDLPRKEPAERDSDEFFSAGSEEREKSKAKALESPKYDVKYNAEDSISQSRYDDDATKSRNRYDDDDMRSVVSSNSRYDDPDREERRRRRREAKSESREQSRDRGYELDEGGERQRRHRRRETDERSDDWDTKSTISEARSEANGERRRKHKRRESERDGSVESKGRSRSSAASEPGDLFDDRKSSRRRSRRDADDDNASVISSTSRYDDDRSSKKEKEKEKEKEKRSSGLFGLFSKSKENLAETSSKSSKSKDDDDEERRHRRRKHRSDRGSTYGSDDDDVRSTISSSSRREKRSSRSERGESDRRDSYDDKVHRSSYAR
ncbi:hypothetical protein BKA66DRAFT_475419 [Pyrenochaeta sp. MPI-SDFR-AT-0127]|nr:hypothetical protein BKA66DRAFT_475419 [Pyrenochaeta sp. MPI-SDFR-AT-0127]